MLGLRLMAKKGLDAYRVFGFVEEMRFRIKCGMREHDKRYKYDYRLYGNTTDK